MPQRLKQLLQKALHSLRERARPPEREYLFGRITRILPTPKDKRSKQFEIELTNGEYHVLDRSVLSTSDRDSRAYFQDQPEKQGRPPIEVGDVVRVSRHPETGRLDQSLGGAEVQTWSRANSWPTAVCMEHFRGVLQANPKRANRWAENFTKAHLLELDQADIQHMLESDQPTLIQKARTARRLNSPSFARN